MPRDRREILIFLASPSDVAPERALVAQTIDEWNQIRGRDRAISFDLLRWEKSVSAGFGEDGQQVINDQIGDEHDLLIGLFWTRLGTRTDRAESGSVEEYERTLARRRTGEDVELAFYMKDAPVDLKVSSIEQLAAVQNFKKRLQDDGALTKDFSSLDALRFEINLLLDRMARHFSPSANSGLSRSTSTLSNVSAANPIRNSDSYLPDIIVDNRNQDIGLLDVQEDIHQYSEKASQFLNEMTVALNRMTSNTSEVSEEMQELGRLGVPGSSRLRPLINRITASMTAFSEFMESRLPDFAENSFGLADSTRSIIDLAQEFSNKPEEIRALQTTLHDVLEASRSNVDSMKGVLTSTLGLQRMTVPFNHARRRLANSLQIYINTVEAQREVMQQALAEVDALYQ